MKCPACGRENRAQAGFCAWCGERLKTAPTAPEEPSAPQAPAAPEASAADQETSLTARSDAPEGAAAPAIAASPVETRPPGGTTPLHPGDVLAQRYRILDLIESGPEGNLYRADDLFGCGACGYDDNATDDAYCRRCGASLEAPRYVLVQERMRHTPEEYEVHFVAGERDYYVTAEPQPTGARPMPTVRPPLRLIWGRATDQGLQRDHNEDYLEAWLYVKSSGGLLGLFVVADGLGGQDSGEVASRMATDAIWQALRQSVWEPIIRDESLPPETLEQRLAGAVKAANQAVYAARLARHSEMSTTVTLALLLNETAYIGNVGDSRTYLWNAAGLQRITKDHSLVQRLVDLGQITPDQVYSHPQRNLIYQSIGDRPDVRVDTFRVRLAPDDHLILCSDGLWEMVHDEGLEEVLLSETDPQRACERLVQNANLAGGEDNISVIIIKAVSAQPIASQR